MKTKEELNALKTEVEELNTKLSELSEEELDEVSGGLAPIRAFIGQIANGFIGGTMGLAMAGTDSAKPRVISGDNIKLD